MSSGRLFQSLGTIAANNRSLAVELSYVGRSDHSFTRRDGWAASWLEYDERGWVQDGMSLTRMTCLDGHRGAVPLTAR